MRFSRSEIRLMFGYFAGWVIFLLVARAFVPDEALSEPPEPSDRLFEISDIQGLTPEPSQSAFEDYVTPSSGLDAPVIGDVVEYIAIGINMIRWLFQEFLWSIMQFFIFGLIYALEILAWFFLSIFESYGFIIATSPDWIDILLYLSVLPLMLIVFLFIIIITDASDRL